MKARAIFTDYIRYFSKHMGKDFFIAQGFDFDFLENQAKRNGYKFACIAQVDKMQIEFNFNRISRIFYTLSKVDSCATNWTIYIYEY